MPLALTNRDYRRPIVPTLLSATVHVALITTLIVDGETPRDRSDDSNFITTALRYLLPPLPEPGGPGERLRFAGASAPNAPTEGLLPSPTGLVREPEPVGVPQGQHEENPHPVESAETVAAEEHAFTFEEVDSVAVRDPESAGPEYPAKLREKSIEGFASIRFVVDSTGRIDLATIEVMEATAPEFVQAVRDVMPRMKFTPARRGAVAVRQLSQQLFRFRIEPPVTPVTARKP